MDANVAPAYSSADRSVACFVEFNAREWRSDMRSSVGLIVVAAAMLYGNEARAQQSIDPEEPAAAVAAPAEPAAAEPAPAEQPIDPYEAEPIPAAAEAAKPPASPAPPSQGYYQEPAAPHPPAAPAPVTACCCARSCCAPYPYAAPPPLKVWDGVRRFSLGAHVGFLTLNQQIGKNQITLGGAGFQLRLRTKGHFGFEASQSFLHGSYWQGAWQRDSFPFSLSLMFYLFPNRDTRHFNLYAVAGAGIVPDSVQLYDEHHFRVTQDFAELELHAGLGAELRFRWFGIEADGRIIGLWRDDSDTPAAYYRGIKGAPVPSSSYGVQGNLYLSIWF